MGESLQASMPEHPQVASAELDYAGVGLRWVLRPPASPGLNLIWHSFAAGLGLLGSALSARASCYSHGGPLGAWSCLSLPPSIFQQENGHKLPHA